MSAITIKLARKYGSNCYVNNGRYTWVVLNVKIDALSISVVIQMAMQVFNRKNGLGSIQYLQVLTEH